MRIDYILKHWPVRPVPFYFLPYGMAWGGKTYPQIENCLPVYKCLWYWHYVNVICFRVHHPTG